MKFGVKATVLRVLQPNKVTLFQGQLQFSATWALFS